MAQLAKDNPEHAFLANRFASSVPISSILQVCQGLEELPGRLAGYLRTSFQQVPRIKGNSATNGLHINLSFTE